MKMKLILGLFVAGTFLYSCGSEPVENAETEMNEQMNNVADSLEQLDEQLDMQKQELEESSNKVDELLNDL